MKLTVNKETRNIEKEINLTFPQPVVEEEAFFSTKCKLFYLKAGYILW